MKSKTPLLDTVSEPGDIRDFTVPQLRQLADELRTETIDAVSINIRAPRDAMQRTSFLAMLENLELEPGEGPARVIINSRTGTVVIGSNVEVTPA